MIYEIVDCQALLEYAKFLEHSFKSGENQLSGHSFTRNLAMIAMLPEDQTFLFINKDNDTMTVDAKWSVHLMNLDIWPRMLTSFMHLLNLVCEEVKMCWGFKDVAPSDMAHPSPIYVVVSADFNNDGYKEQLQQYRTTATTSVKWVDFLNSKLSKSCRQSNRFCAFQCKMSSVLQTSWPLSEQWRSFLGCEITGEMYIV